MYAKVVNSATANNSFSFHVLVTINESNDKLMTTYNDARDNIYKIINLM